MFLCFFCLFPALPCFFLCFTPFLWLPFPPLPFTLIRIRTRAVPSNVQAGYHHANHQETKVTADLRGESELSLLLGTSLSFSAFLSLASRLCTLFLIGLLERDRERNGECLLKRTKPWNPIDSTTESLQQACGVGHVSYQDQVSSSLCLS